MIHFDNLSKRYPGGDEALKSISLHMDVGELAFLTGHSGAGKSTLLKLLMLMERPTSGALLINGTNINRLTNSKIPSYRRQLGVVFQDHQLLMDRSVYDNVALPLQVAGQSRKETGRRVRAALDAVGLLSKERHSPMMLSGGEQQRVGIARAVVHKPRILLADEPTGNLDSKSGHEIMGILNQLYEDGNTIILVTHEDDIAQHARRIIRLFDGKIIEDSEIKGK